MAPFPVLQQQQHQKQEAEEGELNLLVPHPKKLQMNRYLRNLNLRTPHNQGQNRMILLHLYNILPRHQEQHRLPYRH